MQRQSEWYLRNRINKDLVICFRSSLGDGVRVNEQQLHEQEHLKKKWRRRRNDPTNAKNHKDSAKVMALARRIDEQTRQMEILVVVVVLNWNLKMLAVHFKMDECKSVSIFCVLLCICARENPEIREWKKIRWTSNNEWNETKLFSHSFGRLH